MTTKEALTKLIDGNKRYVCAKTGCGDISEQRRQETSQKGQHPFALVIINAVVKNVINATKGPFHSIPLVGIEVSKIFPTALLAKPKPIIIIIGPITIGGRILSIHFFPANLIIVDTIM